MAKVKSVTYRVARKISDNNWGNTTFDLSEEVELEDGDDINVVATDLRNRVIGRLIGEVNALTGQS